MPAPSPPSGDNPWTVGHPRMSGRAPDLSEPCRIAALESYAVLDTPPEEAFDNLTDLAALVAGQPVAPVAGGAGAGAAGPVGVSSAPLTSYVRPSDGAATENAGRPVGLRAGMLGIAPVAPGSTVSMGGPLPLSGAQGMLSAGTRDDRREEPTHARIMLGNSPIHPSSTG